MFPRHSLPAALCVALLAGAGTASAAADEAQALDELRNTVVNLLQGLVDRGVITREQAAQMVSDAQSRAAADAAAVAEADRGAVRVPYVPEIVKEEIREQVKEELRAEVSQQVVQTAKAEGWGVPAALPGWVQRMGWYGDTRVRGEGVLYADDNFPNYYLNYQAINKAGGIGGAGLDQYRNVSEDRERLRLRMRLGFEASLGSGWRAGARMVTGSLDDPISTNQTLGNAGARYQFGLDLAYLAWQAGGEGSRQQFGITGGRIANPWLVASDLIYDHDLTFEGIAANWRLGLQGPAADSNVFATVGAFPLQELEFGRDRWLFGGQLGLDWKFGSGARLRTAASLYDFRDVHGTRNAFNSQLLDYTAPRFLQKGNTVFDIRNDNDPNTQLYALAGDYRLAGASLIYELPVTAGYKLSLGADYVRNIGFDAAKVLARSGLVVPERDRGYQAELSFGSASMAKPHAWRFGLGYRYLQGDAVLDAFTDSDFHLGGTDAKGFTATLDYSITPRVLGRLRYLSANEIDGPPLGIDVVQIDFTASF